MLKTIMWFACLLVLVGLAASEDSLNADWENDYDGAFTFECEEGSHMSSMMSEHAWWHEDRRFAFNCTAGFVGNDCSWSEQYINEFDQDGEYHCPDGGIVTGMESYHDNDHEDRRFKIKCCKRNTREGANCAWTEYLSEFDEIVDFETQKTADANQAITAVHSTHSNHHEDRVWKFHVCHFANCKSSSMRIEGALTPNAVSEQVIGMAATQGCNASQTYETRLSNVANVGEFTSVTVGNTSGHFAYDRTMTLAGDFEAGLELDFLYAFDGTSPSFSKNVKRPAMGQGNGEGNETMMQYQGPGGALLVAKIEQYEVEREDQPVIYQVQCDDGSEYEEQGTASIVALRYGKTSFISSSAVRHPEQCNKDTDECIKAITTNNAVADFDQCFLDKAVEANGL